MHAFVLKEFHILFLFVFRRLVGSFFGVQNDAVMCEQVYAFICCSSGSMSLLPSLVERIALSVYSLVERCYSRV